MQVVKGFIRYMGQQKPLVRARLQNFTAFHFREKLRRDKRLRAKFGEEELSKKFPSAQLYLRQRDFGLLINWPLTHR